MLERANKKNCSIFRLKIFFSKQSMFSIWVLLYKTLTKALDKLGGKSSQLQYLKHILINSIYLVNIGTLLAKLFVSFWYNLVVFVIALVNLFWIWTFPTAFPAFLNFTALMIVSTEIAADMVSVVDLRMWAVNLFSKSSLR